MAQNGTEIKKIALSEDLKGVGNPLAVPGFKPSGSKLESRQFEPVRKVWKWEKIFMSCENQDALTRPSDLILESGPIARGLDTFRQSAPDSIRDRIGC